MSDSGIAALHIDTSGSAVRLVVAPDTAAHRLEEIDALVQEAIDALDALVANAPPVVDA